MKYQFTTQRELRRAFWEQFPNLDSNKYNDKYYCTETRCAFVDWIDNLQKSNQISEALAERVTL